MTETFTVTVHMPLPMSDNLRGFFADRLVDWCLEWGHVEGASVSEHLRTAPPQAHLCGDFCRHD